MRPYALKRDILYHAIQGKLVPHDSDEGTGQELVIENNKQKLDYSSDIQKRIGKGCKPIQESELPFDIPENWAWERFGNLVINYDSQRRPVTKSDRKTTKGLYDYYGATGAIDKVDEYIFDGEFLMIGEDGGNFFVDRDNSFIARGAFWANNHVHVVQPIVCDIGYLKVCLDAYDLPNLGLINGIAVPKLNQENMNSIYIPIPPLAEQKRIVIKIEELLPLIDRYEQAWSRLEDFNKRFPVDMQKSILQMAIQGKLVEQRPEEGTGEELYKQIQVEKQALIKAGKIKKEKPLPEITEDEVPFEIPESWKWCYVGELFQHNTGKALNGSDKSGTPMTYITTSNLYWDRFELEKLKEMPFTESEVEKCTVQKGDLLVCEGGDYGRSAIWPYDYPMRIQNHIHRLRAYGSFSVRYFYYCFFLYKNAGLIAGKGIAIQGLSANALHALKMPLPPLAEQERIVARLEELLPLCERLK